MKLETNLKVGPGLSVGAMWPAPWNAKYTKLSPKKIVYDEAT